VISKIAVVRLKPDKGKGRREVRQESEGQSQRGGEGKQCNCERPSGRAVLGFAQLRHCK